MASAYDITKAIKRWHEGEIQEYIFCLMYIYIKKTQMRLDVVSG